MEEKAGEPPQCVISLAKAGFKLSEGGDCSEGGHTLKLRKTNSQKFKVYLFPLKLS